VTILSGTQVLLDVSQVTLNGGIFIEQGASLYFDWQQDISISVQFILVKGSLYIGTEACAFENKVSIQLTDSGIDLQLDGLTVGRKVIAVGSGGVLELHGSKGRSSVLSWTQLSQTALAGSSIISLADNVGSTSASDYKSWQVGDHLVIASTDFNPLQTEEVVIQSIIDSKTIQLTAPLQYMHFGRVTFGVDERAEVGLLTRSIVVSGDQSVGAQIITLAGASKSAIEGVELTLVGQDQIGRYPIHFHLAGQLQHGYARYNSIHKSQFRCITVHATQGVTIDSNVAYDNLGHCYYLEDGVEENNTYYRNLAVLTQPKPKGVGIGTDRTTEGLAAFWITNTNNQFIDNVAAAGYGTGFWIHTRLAARGLSASMPIYSKVHPVAIPLANFTGNRAHSFEFGFQLEPVNLDNWDTPATTESPPAQYFPVDQNGRSVTTYIDNFSAYKIRFRGIWARCGDFYVRNATLADCFEAVQFATTGAHPAAPSFQGVIDSLFVGVSENTGMNIYDPRFQGWDSVLNASFPMQGEGFVGWKLYDGSQGIQNCRFVNYPGTSSNGKVHSAIGIRYYNNKQMSTKNAVVSSTFTNVVRKVYFVDTVGEGGKAANILDDGSISGKKATVVPDMPFYKTAQCSQGTESYLSCPHKYNQLWVLDMAHNTDQYVNPFTLTRNQQTGGPTSSYQIAYGGFADSGVYRYQPAVSVGASYLLQFTNVTTNKLALQMVNGAQGDKVGLAVCYPQGTTITSVYRGLVDQNGGPGLPSKNQGTQLSSSDSRTSDEVLAGDQYYWDQSRSMLFLTVVQSKANDDRRFFCPLQGCDFLYIQANITSDAVPFDCSSVAYVGPDSLRETSGGWLNTHF